MPGEEIPPNLNAANALAFDYNLTGKRKQFLDQFPVENSTDKVQKLCDTTDGTNVSIRYDNTLYPE